MNEQKTTEAKQPMNTIAKEFNLIARPTQELEGRFQVPGDKSISHRSIMLGAIAEGTTRVANFLQGDDSMATLQAFRDMSIDIELSADEVIIKGAGMYGLKPAKKALWLGNSGTAMRLMTGLLSAQSFACELTGDASLSSRPMARVSTPLAAMGANISSVDGHAPLSIRPVSRLHGIDYQLPVASAQIKSALLFAGLYADSATIIREPGVTRNHSELMMQSFGVTIERHDADKHNSWLQLTPAKQLIAQDITVPGDISSSAFFLVAASIAAKADVVIEAVGINATRSGVLDILRLMGANIALSNTRLLGSEPVADLHIKPAQLQAIDIPEHLVPLAIDEFPVLFIAAACAQGTTRLRGAAELRVKESDRISTMVEGLQQLGIQAQALEDGADIQGGTMTGGEVKSHDDHRIAMAFVVASMAAQQPIRILQCRNIHTSFPGFVGLAQKIGFQLDID